MVICFRKNKDAPCVSYGIRNIERFRLFLTPQVVTLLKRRDLMESKNVNISRVLLDNKRVLHCKNGKLSKSVHRTLEHFNSTSTLHLLTAIVCIYQGAPRQITLGLLEVTFA